MTVPDTHVSTLVTASEIAEIAGVGPSAVSNWKRRHADFPSDVEEGLYERDAIVRWLRKMGKDVTLPEPNDNRQAVWQLADVARSRFRIDDAPEFLLQLFTLRAAASGSYGRLLPLADRWQALRTEPPRHAAELLDAITRELQSTDPELAHALRISAAAKRMIPEDWAELTRLVDGMALQANDWGQAASALIDDYAERHRKRAGEYSSGASLVDLMVALLGPLEGTVYDPACGAARFLASAWNEGSGAVTRLVGQEISEQSWRIGFLHLVLQGADFQILTGDTLLDNQLWGFSADRIALEPPLSQRIQYMERLEGDPRFAFGLPPRSNADLAWVQHVVSHLSDRGIGVVAVGAGALSRRGPEANIRAGLVGSGVLDAVVHLPPGMLGGTSISVALLVLDKNRANRDEEVLFIDAREFGTPERGGLRRLDAHEIGKVASLVASWRSGSFRPQPGLSATAARTRLGIDDCNLTPNRYVEYATAVTNIDDEPIPERLARLIGLANERLARLHEIESEVEGHLATLEANDG